MATPLIPRQAQSAPDVDAAPPVISSDAAAGTQAQINAEIGSLAAEYRRERTTGAAEELRPRLDYTPYRSSILRHPTKDPHHADPEGIELWAPAFGQRDVDPLEADLTIQANGDPVG